MESLGSESTFQCTNLPLAFPINSRFDNDHWNDRYVFPKKIARWRILTKSITHYVRCTYYGVRNDARTSSISQHTGGMFGSALKGATNSNDATWGGWVGGGTIV